MKRPPPTPDDALDLLTYGPPIRLFPKDPPGCVRILTAQWSPWFISRAWWRPKTNELLIFHLNADKEVTRWSRWSDTPHPWRIADLHKSHWDHELWQDLVKPAVTRIKALKKWEVVLDETS